MGNNSKQTFLVCIDNSAYPAFFELYKIYLNIPDAEAESHGDLRVVDESGEDYIYPESCFVFLNIPKKLEKAILHET